MTEILTVAIAGIVAIASAWFTIGHQWKKLRKELESTFNQFLYEERLECYTEAYRICARIRREKPPKFINDHAEVLEISEELHAWASGKGGLLMSGGSINAFQEFFESLRRNPGDGENAYTGDQARKIWRLRTDFRRSLRQDVLSLFPGSHDHRMNDGGSEAKE